MVKTLVLIPVYNSSKTLPQLLSSLYSLDPQPEKFVFAENNSSDDTLEVIKQFKLPSKIIRVWFSEDAAMKSQNRYEPIAHIRQLLLTYARRFDPDYAIFLDSDVIPKTKSLIQNLTSWNKDIVGGAYLRLFPSGVWLASKWKNPDDSGYSFRKKTSLPLEEVALTSGGCLCLSRKIIQDRSMNFYPVRDGASEDFGYCLDAQEKGYIVYLDGVVQLDHLPPESMRIKPWTKNLANGQYEFFSYDTKNKALDFNSAFRKLRIGLISTRFFGVPPNSYSGLEQIVWDLACSLDKIGHEVTLFAPKGSLSPPHGKLVEIGDPIQTCNTSWLKAELEAYDYFKDEVSNLDILHGHNWFGIEYLLKARHDGLHVTHTHHGLSISWLNLFKPLFKLNLISISDWTKDVFAQQGFVAQRCYNGVDLEKYEFKENKGDKFMFLGRIAKSKGPHLAIKAARDAGVGIDIVGSTSFVDDVDYVNEVRGLCDGEQIRFVGEVNQEDKIKYLQNARGLLIPSQFGEPFGLISAEAMACGTVPIALNDGALKEIIIDGQTGFICRSVDQMTERIKELDLISPSACRERAKQFSREKMAEEYTKLYNLIIEGNEW